MSRISRCLSTLLLAVVMGASIVGCASDKQIISQAQNFHQGIDKAVITDAQLQGYLDQLGARIIAEGRALSRDNKGPDAHFDTDNAWMFENEMTFHLVNSDTINAFTTGGKHMYIYSALFDACKTEDELAAVMAHEYAHVYGRHVHKGMDRQYMTLGVAGLAGVAGYALGGDDAETYALVAAGGTLALGQFFNKGFTRADEAEADSWGFRMYARAGWDPDQFAGFFQTMIDLGYDTTPELLSDHPSLSNRVAAAAELAADWREKHGGRYRKAPVADKQQFEALKRRLASVRKNYPSDRSLSNAQELMQALPRSCLTSGPPRDQIEARERVKQRLKGENGQDNGEQSRGHHDQGHVHHNCGHRCQHAHGHHH